jgi:hypothetical protein
MNKLKLISSILVITFLVSSCEKNDNSNSASTNITNIVNQGNWRITLYNDSGTDELYYFSGYTFTFSNGTITAIRNTTTVNGTYSTLFDDSKNKFLLNFGSTVPFDELNDDWHIIEETSTKIRLQDVSGGSGGTDLLTFEKN